MIENYTILILGAGASKPYGLPLGWELRDRIFKWADNMPTDLAQECFWACDHTAEDVHRCAQAFMRSGIASIDTFVLHQPEWANCAKLLIAWEIGIDEKPERLVSHGPDEWYVYLWSRLLAEPPGLASILEKNRLKVITFNYDRSLEHFLYLVAKSTYRTSRQAALEFVKSLDILHVHGAAGTFGLSTGDHERSYAPIRNGRELAIAAAGLRIIPEVRGDSAEFRIAKEWLRHAERIVFMGFSFDEVNCNRLGLAAVLAESDPSDLSKVILACTCGLRRGEIEAMKQYVCPQDDWETDDARNLDFLRNTGALLPIPPSKRFLRKR